MIEKEQYRIAQSILLLKSHNQKIYQYLTRVYVYYTSPPFPLILKHNNLKRTIKNMISDTGCRHFIKYEYYSDIRVTNQDIKPILYDTITIYNDINNETNYEIALIKPLKVFFYNLLII